MSNKKHEFRTNKEAVKHYYNAIKRGNLDIAPYIKKHGDSFEGIDTNRFSSFIFSETGIKPTTSERILRDLRRIDRNS